MTKGTCGYYLIKNKEHGRSGKNGYVRRSCLVCEKVLDKTLPPKLVIHHINHNRAGDRPENLVVCENTAYHSLLHEREKAYKACDHVNWRKCGFCHKYDDPINLKMGSCSDSYHVECKRKYYKDYYINNITC